MRKLSSPVKKYPGTIEFPDFLTLPQYAEYFDVSTAAIGKSGFTLARMLLPVQQKLTGDWDIKGISKDTNFDTINFNIHLLKLLQWIHVEFTLMLNTEDDVPNA